MPEKKRKYRTGAQKRKAAREREESQARAPATTPPAPAIPSALAGTPHPPTTAPAQASSPPPPELGHLDFDRLSPAPVGSPAQVIAWANDVAAIGLEQVMQDPSLRPAERWRWITEFCRTLGMLRDKAAEQHEIRKALAAQDTTERAQGTVPADGRSKKKIPRPPS